MQERKLKEGVSKSTSSFFSTKPRLSQAGALLLPKDFVSLSIKIYTYGKDVPLEDLPDKHSGDYLYLYQNVITGLCNPPEISIRNNVFISEGELSSRIYGNFMVSITY